MANAKVPRHEFYVYAWFRPDGTPFYIGKGHGDRIDSLRGRNPAFMALVAEYGDPPRRKLYEGLSERDAFMLEIDLISEFGRSLLVNQTNGGEGASGYIWSVEMRARKSAEVTGKKHSSAIIAKMSARRKGTTKSAAHRKSLSVSHKGKAKSEAHRLAIVVSKTGLTQSLETVAKRVAKNRLKLDFGETREKLSKAGTGRRHTAETLAAMRERASNISDKTRERMRIAAQNMSAEHRANISAASKNKPKSPEHCAALKAARLRYLAKKRAALAGGPTKAPPNG